MAAMADENGRLPLSVEASEHTPYHSLPDYEFQDDAPKQKMSFPYLSAKNKTSLVSAMYLSIAAILGTFLRIAMAQLFGEHCANPGTIGWLAASSPLCVTKDGSSSRQGGIVFADLPANLLGSFIMGMMQPGSALDLPNNIAVAWASSSSFFQGWDTIHTAIKTGFCGSLTTYSSWNSEMVVMTFGTGDVSKTSQVVSAFFGYIIGMESALGSYVFGMTIATFIHRWRNPRNAEEADAARKRAMEGVYMNHDLPDFERRYLPDLEMDHMEHTVHGVAYLERWKLSTRDARHVNHELLPALCEIENAVLINERPFSAEAEGVAENAGWDLEAVSEWVKLNPRVAQEPPTSSLMLTIPLSVLLFVTLALPMLLGLIFVNDLDSAYQVTYRTMFYSACLAPFGALLRWNLSAFNGKLLGDLNWIPTGTLIANVSGSVISIVMIAMELNMAADGFWTVGTLRAIKVGFCGCLTTVSSFVSEVDSLMKRKPNHYQAYLYILMSLLTSFVLASAVYAWIVYD